MEHFSHSNMRDCDETFLIGNHIFTILDAMPCFVSIMLSFYIKTIRRSDDRIEWRHVARCILALCIKSNDQCL